MGKFYRNRFESFKKQRNIEFALGKIQSLEYIKEIMKEFVAQEFETDKQQIDVEQLVLFLMAVIYNQYVKWDDEERSDYKFLE